MTTTNHTAPTCKPGGCSSIGCEGGHYCFNADGSAKAPADPNAVRAALAEALAPHAKPIGEDAANVEREALRDKWKIVDGDCREGDDGLITYHVDAFDEGYRAALASSNAQADGGKGEPVDFVFPLMPPAVVMHEKVGPLFDRLSMQFYAAKCMTLASQPAQTQVALDDNSRGILSDALGMYARKHGMAPSQRQAIELMLDRLAAR